MAGKWDLLISDYKSGMSLPTVADRYGVSASAARYHVKKAGVLRSRADAVRLAASQGRIGAGLRGKTRSFSAEHRASISTHRKAWGEANATGLSVKPNGYVEYTRGQHKGRAVHVVAMEQRIGRRLNLDEVVHHIDGDRSNNDANNLALMTRSAHTRLHRFEDALAGQIRERNEDGRFR